MTELGKSFRIAHLFDPTIDDAAMVIPMDHPVEAYYPQMEDPAELIDSLINAGATGFLLNRGMASLVAPVIAGRAGWILRITISHGLRGKPLEQIFATTVETALRLGADAVCPTIFLGCEDTRADIEALGRLADDCDKWGMPLCAETFPAGLKGEDSVPLGKASFVEESRLACRIGAEWGADFIKANYTGTSESFRKVVDNCPIPILVAGGPKLDSPRQVLEMVKGIMDAGAAGTIMGRNIWQYANPAAMMRAIALIVREDATIEEAEAELNAV